MQYVERYTLEQRGAVEQIQPEPVEGTLLIGVEPVLQFSDNFSSYGNDYIEIYPAFYNGVRCFVERRDWCAAYGYSAYGTQESIISFEKGVELFLQRGVFEFSAPIE